ncbi:uncharacterized protein ACA1_337630 [Acanthamoeba castellanii str. Neff]|uniref:Uncharacterized protein n=1 Tax=Acanthamoeba castellanii (strain ATCC 30010 / Neff) TaxID=1257118 RepID=L8GP88_ACACF|nr:uncharacterized protein ACA1_337630 [Acanthamoeba castellanii str. Neff]ELR14707.1 hypothetical protein ACA1_337630 [Acanthamoeba castellanii str. Neff]
MSESSTPTTTNALVEQQGERRSKRRHRATVKRAVGSNESPAIWAARHQDGRAFDGDRVEFGFNLFHSEADATRLTATRAATANRKSIVDKTEAAIVGDTWVSPAFPDIDGEDDTDVFLTIEVQAARSHGQSGNEIVGYDAWFDGKRELSNMSALPNANVSRAVIEGCMKAIEHARNPETGSAMPPPSC